MDKIVAIFCLIIVLVYFWLKRIYTYWQDKGVPCEKPILFFGNLKDVFLSKECFNDNIKKLYNKFKNESYFGYYSLWKPCLVIRDPDLVKDVLIKDFHKFFYDRPWANDKKADPLGYYSLVLLKNPLWKKVRTQITPLFSLAKLKLMMPLMIKCDEELIKYLKQNDGKVIDFNSVIRKKNLNEIASCAFGIEANSFKEEISDLELATRKMLDFNNKSLAFQMFAYFYTPNLVSYLNMKFVESKSGKFFKDLFWKIINSRKNEKVKRNDLIDILIELEVDEEILKDDNFLPAQAILFLMAGFETSSSNLCFILYELCLHQDIQSQLRDEIKKELDKHGNLTYECIQKMKYLNMVCLESFRKYPAIAYLARIAAENYKIRGSEFIVEKGTPIFLPIAGFHYDENYFPEPEKFDPERFSDVNKDKIPSCVYMPFGEGPRNCIGDRFGLLTVKLAVIYILSNFKLERCNETDVPLRFYSKAPVLTATNIKMKIKSI